MSSTFPALRIMIFLTVLTGGVYPLLVTGIAQVAFPKLAAGNWVMKDGKTVGSAWVAQKFEKPYHFASRPSAGDYNAFPSGASNAGPTSADLLAKVNERRAAGSTEELLFSSGSGLDPHIRPGTALTQIPRIALALQVPSERVSEFTQNVTDLVNKTTEPRDFGIFGEPRVNVLKLNLLLDETALRMKLAPAS